MIVKSEFGATPTKLAKHTSIDVLPTGGVSC